MKVINKQVCSLTRHLKQETDQNVEDIQNIDTHKCHTTNTLKQFHIFTFSQSQVIP